MPPASNTCPLCSKLSPQEYHVSRDRAFFNCPVCDLVFADPDSYLIREAEFERYELHNNDPNDPRYRNFLEKLLNPMLERITVNSSGLDFGSGPTPLFKIMAEKHNHQVAIYDSFYTPDSSVFKNQYDFIVMSEVVEHLHQPFEELERLWTCLKPGGYLGIMTGILHKEIEFPDWYYHRDPTHVIFFSPASFQWLARHWSADIEFVAETVVIFHKSKTS